MRVVLSVLLLLVAAVPVAAQSELSLEASVIRGTLGYARGTGAGTLLGVELGLGFPQLDRTLLPTEAEFGGPDFEEFLHVAVFMRRKFSERVELDGGVRASIGDLYECGSSDCLPAPFVGAYLQPMAGGRRLKVGARVTAGWINESENSQGGSTFTVGIAPFLVRYTLPL